MTTELHDQRLDAVVEAVRECRAAPILDLGCGVPSHGREILEAPLAAHLL